MKHTLFAGLCLTMVAAPAAAQQVQFSGTAKGEVGYGTNPFLRPGAHKGAAHGSITVAPKMTYQTARSTTMLSGSYARDQYLNDLGHTDSLVIGVNRTDLLNAHLTSTLAGEYHTSNRAIFSDTATDILQDPLNIGRRTHGFNANYGLQWQPSAADQITYGAQYQNLSYGNGSRGAIPGARASSYDQYSINAGYSRTIDARTSVGAQASLSVVRSKVYPDSRSVQPSLTAKRQLNAIWNFDGHIGLVLQRVYGPFGRSTTSLGFGLSLCGVYPRSRMCLTAERASAPSGFGGLRLSTGIAATFSHEIDSRSRMNFAANYSKSSSNQVSAISVISDTRAVLASGEYDHDVTQRISAGFGGRYQWRDIGTFGTAHAVSGTIHITAKLGRI